MKGLIRPSIIQDPHNLHNRLRSADKVELDAAGVDPLFALLQGHLRSYPTCYTVVVQGQVAAMFGVAPGLSPEFGSVWLLGSDDLFKIRSQLIKESKGWLAKISEGYELIYNVVHEDNKVHIRWIDFLGFKFLRHVSPHIEFARIPPCVK